MMQDKIEIYSIHYNRPDLIELQLKSFQKFIEQEFQFTVINNSIFSEVFSHIRNECDRNNIKHLSSDNHVPHGPMHYGWSHIHGMNFFKKQLIDSDAQFVFLIEHDVFFCSHYKKISEIVKEHGVCGVFQNRRHINYFHPGILLFNKAKSGDLSEFDFRGDVIENGVFNKDLDGVQVDTGGQTHKYIKNNPERIYFIDRFVSNQIEDIQADQVLYHMVNGSNWSGTANEINAIKLLHIKRILNV